MKKRNLYLLCGVWLMMMVVVVSSALTLLASGSNLNLFGSKDAQLLQRYARLEEVRETLMKEYYQDVDEEALINGAINGMMASLGDTYTFYYTPEEMEIHMQETGGEAYSGVGLLVENNADGFIEVMRVYDEAPADEAGVCPGDLIVAVNGETVSGESAQSLNAAVDAMRLSAGEAIRIRVLRGNETIDFQVVPGEVCVNNAVYSMIGDHIGYINIFQFSGNVVKCFDEALESLQNSGAQALIVDVRNNPGGLLDDVVSIADSLLGEGLIVYTQDRQGSRQSYYSDAAHCNLPLVVLVNEMSASASEILAAAVQDHDRGMVIGEQTYGKGIVQTLVYFEDGAGMQYTSASYCTPSGKSIHGTGVTPDICANGAEDFHSYSGIPDLENDLQLLEAIAYLNDA